MHCWRNASPWVGPARTTSWAGCWACRPPAPSTPRLVRRTLAGLVIGMVETTSQSAIQALLVLFSMPDALAKAVAAAKADDDDALAALVFEALRFRPDQPDGRAGGQGGLPSRGGRAARDADPQGLDHLRADVVGHVRPARTGKAGRISSQAGPTTITCTSPPACTPASAATSARSRSRRSSSPCSSCPACARPARRNTTAPSRRNCSSVRLEIFQQRHAVGLGQVGAPEMAAIAVAGPRGVDEAVLLAA